jgi:hypothetical protein
VFGDHEPVVQSHPLLPDARPPQFGRVDIWDLNGVVERPVNQYSANYRIVLAGLNPTWNLRAREMAMVWLNPRHPAVLAVGVHLKPQPREPRTVVSRVGTLRSLAAWAAEQQLPDDLAGWDVEDFHRYLHACTQRLAIGSVNEHIVVIKALHQFGPVLADRGLPADPWPGRPASHVLGLRYSDELSTPVLPPEAWFPLVRGAWTYIHTFGPDILRARATWQGLQAKARPLRSRATTVLTRWLADPDRCIPVHTRAGDALAGKVNWSMLGVMIGASDNVFHSAPPAGQRLRARVLDEVAAGRGTQTGVITDLHQVTRPDGSIGPWHPGLHPRQMWLECIALRNACYIFTAALSMMRDSELRAITHDSVVEHYGAPAVAATKRKRDPDLPTRHWWIIEPVAQALLTAAELSEHPELTFASVRGTGNENELFASTQAIESFIARVNTHRQHTGLDTIPTDRVTPHMFRRTMAMLTRDYAGSEIALGMQLKHAATRALANRSTQGYAATAPAWARYFDDALASARFERLRDLYDTHRRGQTIGYGPAADRLRDTFDTVTRTAQTQQGDARVEYDLLRRARISLRFGTLNHCALDEANPTDAKCLDNAVVPPGHRGPLVDRCQPGRCANSVIGPEHLPVWRAEEHSLLTLLDTPNLAPCRRTQLTRELDDVHAVLRKATP